MTDSFPTFTGRVESIDRHANARASQASKSNATNMCFVACSGISHRNPGASSLLDDE
jgi:hypothetical protein